MKSVKLILTTTLAVVVAVTTLGIQSQNVAAFNEENNDFVSNTHNHLRIGGEGPEGIQSSSGGQYNDEDIHGSYNYNSERGEHGQDSERVNNVDKPDNDDDEVDETEP